MSEMLCLNHICVSYGSRQILHGIDLSLQPGEFCALLGLNGSGKQPHPGGNNGRPEQIRCDNRCRLPRN